eukprot:EG_transcript_7500
MSQPTGTVGTSLLWTLGCTAAVASMTLALGSLTAPAVTGHHVVGISGLQSTAVRAVPPVVPVHPRGSRAFSSVPVAGQPAGVTAMQAAALPSFAAGVPGWAVGVAVVAVFLAVQFLCKPRKGAAGSSQLLTVPTARGTSGIINPAIEKEQVVVVDVVDGGVVKGTTAMCRCWLSGKWPNCDGAHAKHNAETGDNVGPLLISAASGEAVAMLGASGEKAGVINPAIRKEEAKVVDTLDAGAIKGKAVMCRCWLSTTWPKCDGAHAKHNAETGDNVGPLIVSAPAPVEGPVAMLGASGEKAGIINPAIRKEEAKVVDTLDAGAIKGKAVMCRCWLSKTWPKCDGAHAKHNAETGDNVGPLIVSAPAPAEGPVAMLGASGEKAGIINPAVRKEEAKVVDTLDAGAIKGKAVMCRCWLSKTWPKCDGAHAKHNAETGDNVGPLIVSAPAPAEGSA